MDTVRKTGAALPLISTSEFGPDFGHLNATGTQKPVAFFHAHFGREGATMDLSEDEKRMVYQIEGTDQNTALNEVYMTWRCADSQAVKDTAEGVLRKLRPLSDRECMDVIREVQRTYRLPEKPRTIGELLAEARQKSGAQKLAGHDIMALERFDPDTRHMIVFDVLTHDSPVGWKGDKMRLFLTEAGYKKALENQDRGHIRIRNHARVVSGDLRYDRKDREL